MVEFQLSAAHYHGIMEAVSSSLEPATFCCSKNDTKCDVMVRRSSVKNGTVCNVNCRCKNCDNPCELLSTSGKHKDTSSIEFAQSKQQELLDGPLTTFFFLKNILVCCDEEDIEPTSVNV